MEFEFQAWSVEKLMKLYADGKLNLNPPYQRNAIWSEKTQRGLINSLKAHSALPTFFLLEKSAGAYEVVDGQQRTRTLISYFTTTDLDKKGSDESFKNDGFKKYSLNITLITKLEDGEDIEDFYARINSSGTALNRPETFKAMFFETKLLSLVESLSVRPDFVALDLVALNSKKRMLDRDLVEELVALSVYGIKDKKDQVDKMYENDITDAEAEKATKDFDFAMNVFSSFNKFKALKSTRYRQRNDFYTLFGYIINNQHTKPNSFLRFYQVLLALEPGIKPDKNSCEPLADYAFTCVSQSNSARARESRSILLQDLLISKGGKPSSAQKTVIKFYTVPKEGLEEFDGGKVFVPVVLKKQIDIIEYPAHI